MLVCQLVTVIRLLLAVCVTNLCLGVTAALGSPTCLSRAVLEFSDSSQECSDQFTRLAKIELQAFSMSFFSTDYLLESLTKHWPVGHSFSYAEVVGEYTYKGKSLNGISSSKKTSAENDKLALMECERSRSISVRANIDLATKRCEVVLSLKKTGVWSVHISKQRFYAEYQRQNSEWQSAIGAKPESSLKDTDVASVITQANSDAVTATHPQEGDRSEPNINQTQQAASNAGSTETSNSRREASHTALIPGDFRQTAPFTRRALVIGNDSYQSIPQLRNARADAEAVARAFSGLGYSVTSHLDLNEKGMKRVLRDFMSTISGGDEVMFFYAGHGVQIGGLNFLLPVDIKADNERAVRDEAISLQRILDDMSEAKARLTVAIIDACRDNPFSGSGRSIGGRGLSPTSAVTGQVILFSAGSGQQALDSIGPNDPFKNGLFTRTLLKHINRPGETIDRVMRTVRNEVALTAKSVGHEQVPALYDQVIGDFYFAK